jgi:hypothetical protein
MPSPQEIMWGSSTGTCMAFPRNHPLWGSASSVSCHSYFWWSIRSAGEMTLQPPSSTALQQKRRRPFVTAPLGLYQRTPVSFPSCHFLMPWRVIFFASLHPYQVTHLHLLTSGLWLGRALKERFSHWTGSVFSHHCPAVTPKKGASCWQCPVEECCVSCPWGAQLVPALSSPCDCRPGGECSLLPPWSCLLFSEHYSCSDTESQPQQGSLVLLCWQSLVKHFFWGKGQW